MIFSSKVRRNDNFFYSPSGNYKVEINTKVGNGSEVRVQYNEYNWEYAGKSGVSLDFQGMQVLELVEMKSSDGDELSPFGDGEEF